MTVQKAKGSKVHTTVDTMTHLLAIHVTSASGEGHGDGDRLARTVPVVTNDALELAWVGQGYAGEHAFNAAASRGIALKIVKLPEAKRGFVFLSRCRCAWRSFAWRRFRRVLEDYERYEKHSQDFTSSPSPA